jgi:predicted transglutaminase-like cysteine proteinase
MASRDLTPQERHKLEQVKDAVSKAISAVQDIHYAMRDAGPLVDRTAESYASDAAGALMRLRGML